MGKAQSFEAVPAGIAPSGSHGYQEVADAAPTMITASAAVTRRRNFTPKGEIGAAHSQTHGPTRSGLSRKCRSSGVADAPHCRGVTGASPSMWFVTNCL